MAAPQRRRLSPRERRGRWELARRADPARPPLRKLLDPLATLAMLWVVGVVTVAIVLLLIALVGA